VNVGDDSMNDIVSPAEAEMDATLRWRDVVGGQISGDEPGAFCTKGVRFVK
jgi:hypothetical protein